MGHKKDRVRDFFRPPNTPDKQNVKNGCSRIFSGLLFLYLHVANMFQKNRRNKNLNFI